MRKPAIPRLVFTVLLALSTSFSPVFAYQIPLRWPQDTSTTAKFASTKPSQQEPHFHLISHDVEEYIHDLLSKHLSPGLAAAVVLQDPSAHGGFRDQLLGAGYARTSTSPHVPVTPDTLFAIASNSKLFLALSAGLLIKNDSLNIDWTTKISSLIPEWELADPIASQEATILDLLVHRTGLPRHDYAGAPLSGGIPAMIANLRHLRPSAPFRSTFQYNNMMYETISYLPERLLNISFESYVEQHIFTPAGMNASTYDVKDALARKYPPGYVFPESTEWYSLLNNANEDSIPMMAEGHQHSLRNFYHNETGKLRPTVPYFQHPGEERIWAGAGGVLTSVRDMVPWLSLLLNRGVVPHTNATLIPQDVLDRLETGVTVSEGKAPYPELSPKVYGPGQWRYTYRGHEIIEHGGNNPGFKTQVARLPNLAGKIPSFPNATGLGIAVFSNDAAGSEIIESVKLRIIDDLLRLDKIDWYSRFNNEVESFYSKKRSQALPRPSNPQPPPGHIPSLQDATFSHPAYGILKPCYVPPGAPNATTDITKTTKRVEHGHGHGDDACAAFLQHPTTQLLLSKTPVREVPTILIPFRRTFASHLCLTHWSGPWFNLTVAWGNHEENDEPDDERRILIGLDERFEVEWVINENEEGLAFRGGIWGMEGNDARSPEGYGKEGAEVWFSKVKY